jgi:hypothetical protein
MFSLSVTFSNNELAYRVYVYPEQNIGEAGDKKVPTTKNQRRAQETRKSLLQRIKDGHRRQERRDKYFGVMASHLRQEKRFCS